MNTELQLTLSKNKLCPLQLLVLIVFSPAFHGHGERGGGKVGGRGKRERERERERKRERKGERVSSQLVPVSSSL